MNDYFNHVTCFEVIYYFIYKVQTYPQSITQIIMFQKIICIGFLVLNIVDCRRIARDASIVFDDDMVYMGRPDGINFSIHIIHDIFDEAMFYEFLETNKALTRENVEAYINQVNGSFRKLTDQEFEMVFNKWIYQILPGYF